MFAFGHNIDGHLDVGDTDIRVVPTLLRGELENKSVVQVAAGFVHTMFVIADGLVFACGQMSTGSSVSVTQNIGWCQPCMVKWDLRGKVTMRL